MKLPLLRDPCHVSALLQTQKNGKASTLQSTQNVLKHAAGYKQEHACMSLTVCLEELSSI